MPRPRPTRTPQQGRLLALAGAVAAAAVAALLWLALSDDGAEDGGAALVSGREPGVFDPDVPDAAELAPDGPARAVPLADDGPSGLRPLGAPGAGGERKTSGSTLVGRVIRRDGSPVRGAVVFAEAGASATFERAHAWTLGAAEPVTTGIDGRFQVTVAMASHSPSAWLFVGRDRSDQYLQSFTLQTGDRRDVGKVVLEPGGLLLGRLLGPQGQPVAGAEVRTKGPRTSGGQAVDLVETDGEGRFALGAWGPGQARLEITPEDHEELLVPDVAVAPGRVVDLGVLYLRSGGRIEGVLVTPEGDPVLGQKVWAFATDAWSRSADGTAESHGQTQVETTTDDEGRFVVGGLAEGVFELIAQAPGHALSHLRGVRTGQTVRFALREAATLLLDVRDAVTGAPVEHANIRAMPQLIHRKMFMPVTVTSGRTFTAGPEPYHIEGIGEEPVTLKVEAKSYALHVLKVTDLQPGEVRRRTLELEPEISVTGSVTDYDGEPVPGVELIFTAEPGTAAFADVDGMGGMGAGRVVASSSAEGEFESQGLSRGRWRLRVRLVEGGHVGPPETTLDLQGGGLDRLSIRLMPYASLSGRLLSTTGESAAGRAAVAAALVEERPWPPPVPVPASLEITSRPDTKPLPRSRVLGIQGGGDHYTLTGLTPGVYRVQATTADPRVAARRLASVDAAFLPPEVVTVEVRAGELLAQDLTLALPGSVRGRVLVAGAPAGAGSVVLATAGQPSRIVDKATTDGGGSYAFEEVAAGDYVVVAAAQGHPVPRVRSLSVGAGQHLLLDFAFTGHTLRGRVVDDITGAPAPAARVRLRGRETSLDPTTLYGLASNLPSLLRQGGDALFDQTTAADGGGHFWIEGLPAATYWLSAEGDVWRSAGETQVRIDDLWSPEEVVVKVRAAAGLEGWVSYEAGGVPGKTIRAVLVPLPETHRRVSMELSAGHYRFGGQAPGPYEIRIEDLSISNQGTGPKVLFKQRVELTPGALQRLDVTLGG